MKMLNKWLNSQRIIRKLSETNSPVVVKPFLHGCQIKQHRLFANYVFIPSTTENLNFLEKRNFVNFREYTKSKNVNVIDDFLIPISESIKYNIEYNILIALIPINSWELLNKTLNIAEKTTKDLEIQRKLIINTFAE